MKQGAGEGLLVHGTCVALPGGAVLLRGAPGSGKSDLALRFISSFRPDGAVLVSDDQVRLTSTDGTIVAGAPDTIAGKLEVRGVGIVAMAHEAGVPLKLIVDMKPANEIARMPGDPLPCEVILGVALSVAVLNPFEGSAPIKLRLLLTGNI